MARASVYARLTSLLWSLGAARKLLLETSQMACRRNMERFGTVTHFMCCFKWGLNHANVWGAGARKCRDGTFLSEFNFWLAVTKSLFKAFSSHDITWSKVVWWATFTEINWGACYALNVANVLQEPSETSRWAQKAQDGADRDYMRSDVTVLKD